MRAKIVLTASGLALAILAPALYFHLKPDAPAPTPEQPAPVAETAPVQASAGPSILQRVSHPSAQESLPGPTSADSMGLTHEEYVTQRKAELAQLGMSDDPKDLKTILGEMQNPDQEIRKAALSAAVDFHSIDAVPTLESDFAYATDPEEKIAIQQAVEFLKLPSINSPDALKDTAVSAAAGN